MERDNWRWLKLSRKERMSEDCGKNLELWVGKEWNGTQEENVAKVGWGRCNNMENIQKKKYKI